MPHKHLLTALEGKTPFCFRVKPRDFFSYKQNHRILLEKDTKSHGSFCNYSHILKLNSMNLQVPLNHMLACLLFLSSLYVEFDEDSTLQ